ncbi:septation protein IspZ [Parasphingorhabdus halotolerans]|uniref:Inner membrane-spanning protein YciB n=1 Tax=Parasphingorhabdus halotolerans TaxID=2725558 RepID=A0A6H2DJ27_9SPHN|nr:septation protein IspZ [Parasphingorhabdus halotolerans]QJB68334.1 septation protein IspZ [Parasphingorhabdus halotolerans]
MTERTTTNDSNDAEKPAEHKGLSFALDFGPLLIFFLAYKFSGIIAGTAAFMIAIIIAVIVSKWKIGKVSPMLWISAVLIIGFGALTIYFNDPVFIQHKPTIIYAGFAAILIFGLLRGKAMLKYLLQAAFEGLDQEGWMKLSRNWALFFVAMAVANEIMVFTLSFDTWLTVKVWGMTVVSFVFAMANIPMLMRHGLAIEETADPSQEIPPQ